MYILVAAGLILFLTGFLGCFGAIRENKYLLCMVRIQLDKTREVGKFYVGKSNMKLE